MTTVLLIIITAGWWNIDRGLVSPVFDVPEINIGPLQVCKETKPQLLNNDAADISKEIILASNNLIRWQQCHPGQLKLNARGSIFDDYGAYLIITLGTETLWEGEIREETQSIQVAVPHSGWLAVAFVNDAYAPPKDRNLWLSNIEFIPKP